MQNTVQNQKIDVMFDTNVFNHVLGGQKLIDSINEKMNVFATHIQRDEISKTRDEVRKSKLLSIFQELTAKEMPSETAVIGISRIGQAKITGNVLPTESAVWGVSGWDDCKWSEDVVAESGQDIAESDQQALNLYNAILRELNAKNNGKSNNKEDALIAETAIKNRLILVTHDKDLFAVVTKLQGAATNIYALVGAIEYRSVRDAQ